MLLAEGGAAKSAPPREQPAPHPGRQRMQLQIRPLAGADVEALVDLSLAAWAPVFRSFQQILGPAIYARLYPDWRQSQRETVEGVCRDGDATPVWVAEREGRVVGFVAYKLKPEDMTGQVWLLAVHPDAQNQGIGTALNRVALAQMRAAGMHLAVADTGGDPSHAPARRAYEKAGYTGLPLVRYFQALQCPAGRPGTAANGSP
jgi:ribosomal protein S18 acetylase RimI-like enzyme